MRRFAHGASSCGGNSGASRREDIASVGPDILPRPEKAVRRGGTATRGGREPDSRGARARLAGGESPTRGGPEPDSWGARARLVGGQSPTRGDFRSYTLFWLGRLRSSVT